MSNVEKLVESVSGVLGVAVESINENSNQDNIEKWDSLAMVNLVTELETVFDVQFDILEIAEFHSVEIIKLVLIEKGIQFE
jgi:acyl carrier protein